MELEKDGFHSKTLDKEFFKELKNKEEKYLLDAIEINHSKSCKA